MSKGLDEGDILKIYEENILPKDTNLSLRERLVKKSSEILGDTLEDWINGNIQPQKQDSGEATYCWQSDISKENAKIDWKGMDPAYIERMVRALIPWPVAWTLWNGKRIKLFNVDIIECNSRRESGQLFIDGEHLLFSTKSKDTCLKVNRLQIEGKQEMSAQEFVHGQKLDLS